MQINKIYTGSKFFGKKIFIESFDDKELDAALKSVFHDHYHGTAPLRMGRADCQLLLNSDKQNFRWRNDMTYDDHIDCDNQLSEAEDKILQQAERIQELGDYLIEFGDHKKGCLAIATNNKEYCSCGFEQALKGGE